MSSKFFLYCRASTPQVAHPSHSLEGQKNTLTLYAQKHGLVVSQIFFDSSSTIRNRPGFTEMLQKLELGEASGILVTDINRLARNTSDGQRLLDMLDRKKLQIQTPAFAFDKSSLMLHLHMLLQRQEALSCSIKRGLQMRKWRRNLR